VVFVGIQKKPSVYLKILNFSMWKKCFTRGIKKTYPPIKLVVEKKDIFMLVFMFVFNKKRKEKILISTDTFFFGHFYIFKSKY